MKNIEQELKLLLTAREYDLLSKLTTNLPQLQTNFYFRAEQRQDPNVMVRIRQKNDGFLLCYKSRISSRQGVMVCDERECQLQSDVAQTFLEKGLTAAQLNAMLQTNFAQNFVYVGQMDTFRTTFLLEHWRLELDKSVYLGTCDYELECECQSEQSLEQLKQLLNANFGVEIRYSLPKMQRFFERKERLNNEV